MPHKRTKLHIIQQGSLTSATICVHTQLKHHKITLWNERKLFQCKVEQQLPSVMTISLLHKF